MIKKEYTIQDTMRPILDFLESRPAISVNKIVEPLDFHVAQFYDFKNGKRNDFPEKHIWPLVVELCHYGFEAGGWRFSYDEDVHCIFIETPTGKQVDAIIHEEGSGSWIEHKVSVSRALISEEYKLIDFLNKC